MSGPLAAEPPAAPPPVRRRDRIVSVKRGFGWALSGYAVYMVCQWAMLVVLSKWGDRELRDVALFAIALAVTTPIIQFSNMGLRRVYASDSSSEFRFFDYFGLRMATNGVALALIVGVAFIGGFRFEAVLAILAMAVAKVVESTTDVLHGFFQARGRIDIGARGTMLRGVLSLAGFLAAFLATGHVTWAILGMGAGWTAVLLFYEWPWAVRFRRESLVDSPQAAPRARAPLKSLMLLASVALPLGVVALVTSIKGSIPTFVIGTRLGETALGLFAALIYFYHGSNRVVSALGEAAAARLAVLYAAGNERGVKKMMARMMGVALVVSGAGLGVALAVGGPLVTFLCGAEGAGMGGLLVAIMAAACVANFQTILDYGMVATRHFRIQPYLYGSGALLLLVLSVALTPSMGLKGAVLALGIVSGLEFLAAGGVFAWAMTHLRSPASPPELAAR